MIWVEAGVGAVATQAMGERAFGPQGLQMMAEGSPPDQVVATLMAADSTPSLRQIGVIDSRSTPAAHTGADCVPDAAQQIGLDCVAQANMMANPGVPQAMVTTFESTSGDLAQRLLAALDAAQARGGDFRGMQSAGLVVRTGARGTPPWETTVVNVRVDDDPEPLAELRRLATLTRISRGWNVPLERLAAGDQLGAIESARGLCADLPDDLDIRVRLGLALAASGHTEGTAILADLVQQSAKWLAYIRTLCLRYGIDPEPILASLR